MTRNLTPRSNGEGSIGTSIKRWLEGWFGTVNATTVNTGSVNTGSVVATGNVGAATYTGDGSGLTGIGSGTGGVINTGSTTIGADSDDNGSGEIALQTRGVTRATIDNGGNVGIGITPITRNNSRLQIVDGIGFPATRVLSTDPNTLDEYEEGTWTPVIVMSGSTGDLSYSAVGKYTKIGSTVFFSMDMTSIGHTTATGYISYVSGLPFSVPLNSAGGGGYIDNFTGITGGISFALATTGIYIYASGTGQTVAIAASSIPASAGVLRVCGFYQE